jgi:hypothetical protein
MSAHRRRSGKKKLGFQARGGTSHGDWLGAPRPAGKPRGISNEQAKELGGSAASTASRTTATA